MTDSKHLIETTISSEIIFTGAWTKLRSDKVALPDGTYGTREYIEHSGAVAIIAITPDEQIILEYQYRHPVKRVLLEIPAGKLDPDELTLNAAKRELQEETGYYSNTWIKLGTILPCIGYSTEQITYYLAQNVLSGVSKLDVGEFLEITTIPLNIFTQHIQSGKIIDGKTIIGWTLYQNYLLNSRCAT